VKDRPQLCDVLLRDKFSSWIFRDGNILKGKGPDMVTIQNNYESWVVMEYANKQIVHTLNTSSEIDARQYVVDWATDFLEN
jgi:hypothetical protein